MCCKLQHYDWCSNGMYNLTKVRPLLNLYAIAKIEVWLNLDCTKVILFYRRFVKINWFDYCLKQFSFLKKFNLCIRSPQNCDLCFIWSEHYIYIHLYRYVMLQDGNIWPIKLVYYNDILSVFTQHVSSM